LRTFKIVAAALTAAAVLPLAALAQQAAPVPAVMNEQQPDQVLSDSYIGAKVVARSDQGLEDVGTVAELVLGLDDKIVGVVVDVGGFLGVGAKSVGLSWASLTEERADGELLLKTELTRQDFEDAPAFKTLADTQVESDKQMMEGQTAPAPSAQ
jgi:opacity protein-like surface antigen